MTAREPEALGPFASAVAGVAVAMLLAALFLVDANQADRWILAREADLAAWWGGR